MKAYEAKIAEVLHTFETTQQENMIRAANAIVDALEQGHEFYTIGTGHSHMVAEEFYGRAGGLACVKMIAPPELTLCEHPLKSTTIERISAYAQVIFTQYPLKAGDVLLIASNSGRNGMIVELARECKRRGIKTIGFTNLHHSSHVTSRHESGKRLFELCDIVIDSCGVQGDATLDVESVPVKMGATSSIVGMYMAQALSMEIAMEMARRGMEVPVFTSSNVDGGDAGNYKLMQKYYGI